MPSDTRRDTLILALRTLPIVSESLQRGDEGGSFKAESRLMTMPAAWHAGCPPDCHIPNPDGSPRCRSTYQRLLTELARLRRMGKAHYWHVTRRYVVAEHITKTLANHKGVYYNVEARQIAGERMFFVAAPLPGNTEVLRAIAQPRASVRVQGAKPHEKRPVVVRAIVERWDPEVIPRITSRALDVLSFLMPPDIVLPRDVLEAAGFGAPKKQPALARI